MLTEVLAYLRNWFEHAKFFGIFTIRNGTLRTQYSTGISFDAITPKNGQYIRIVGSALNDGVYRWPVGGLLDEEFDGAVWLLAVPPVILSIADDIDTWQQKNGSADSVAMSPFQSESFGGYSYSKGSGSAENGGSSAVTWESAFRNRLSPWRKI